MEVRWPHTSLSCCRPLTQPVVSFPDTLPPQGTGQVDKMYAWLVGGSDYYNQYGVGGEGTVLEKEGHIGTWV